MFYSTQHFTFTRYRRDTREWVTDAKFSSDGETLALGSRDNNIYLYDVGNGYAARAVFSKHTSFVTHLDFSSDSQWIMSNSGADDLLWCGKKKFSCFYINSDIESC